MGTGASRPNDALVAARRENKALRARLDMETRVAKQMRLLYFADRASARRKEDVDDSCVVCCDASAAFALVSCGHLCLCEGCVPLVFQTQQCPMCRQPVQAVQRIFSVVPDNDVVEEPERRGSTLSQTWA